MIKPYNRPVGVGNAIPLARCATKGGAQRASQQNAYYVL